MKKLPKLLEQGDFSPASPSVSFFDLDHTLITANCSALFGFYLYKKGVVGLPKSAFLLSLYLLHKWKLLSLTSLHQWSFKFLFKGESQKKFVDFVQEQVKTIFSERKCAVMNAILEKSRPCGKLYIVSASPDFIVESYAKLFNVDGFYATEYCTDSHGVFSHVGTVVDGEAKWAFAKNKIGDCVSYAYSDDISDKVLLDGVTYGVLTG